MTEARVRTYRERQAAAQHQQCFYCGFPMWSKHASEFAEYFGITRKEANRFHCTAEHLVARRDGGTSELGNIVAACWFCNINRHRRRLQGPDPDRYKQLVQKRVKGQAWHPRSLHRMLTKHYTDLML